MCNLQVSTRQNLPVCLTKEDEFPPLTNTENRIRRVKCDEQKPACYKCVSTGRTCSGYVDPGEHTTQAAVDAQNRFRIVQYMPEISQPTRMWQVPQSTGLLLESEYRSLEFFQINTTLCFGSGIGTFLLQAVHHEQILKSIAIALGSLHRSFTHKQSLTSDNREETRFTLLHYNKAIRDLVAINPKASYRGNDTFLIACILFYCFDCLQGNFKSAFQHAISGLKIIKHEQLIANVSGVGTYMPVEKITLLFSILENQVLEIENEGILTSELRPTASSFLHPAKSPSTSNDIETLFISFQFLYNRFTRFLAICDSLGESLGEKSPEFLESIQSITAEYAQVRTNIETWIFTFENWLEQPSSRRNDSDSVQILKVWRLIIGIFLQLPLPPSELDWDHFTDDFSAVNRLVANFLDAPSKSTLSRHSSPNTPTPTTPQVGSIPRVASLPTLLPKPSKSETCMFSLSLGVVTPLYLCATRCRESSVRHHSIGLMSYCQRREGLWDSDLAARIAKRIVTIEEEAAQILPGSDYTPANIGPSCRVVSLSPAFEHSGQVKIRYNREGHLPVMTEEIFTW
ncbi:hypothetical protein N7509_006005 [Penicillium cosmopolitanum]|uniref:Zn(2)-C6 fungal-type domain-containing protein n=1 Tax=Penicillium cosmopolitanum TaxID=1131564 RepID=A0A9X0BAL9_9EURO|nr:uncharacterized protein N7509_006005 [Penicillium cosmopolitanum]KAJ5397892.1 hypothetical protein N7509_006005 [Penicillium cosmopolitanum]